MTAIIRSRKVLSVLVSLVIMLSVFSVFGRPVEAADQQGLIAGTEYAVGSIVTIQNQACMCGHYNSEGYWGFVFSQTSYSSSKLIILFTAFASDVAPASIVCNQSINSFGTYTDNTSYFTPVFNNSVYPAASDLTYNGTAQALVTAGSTQLFQYSTDGSNWDSNIPTATDAGTYTVMWRIANGNTVYDSGSVDCEIKTAALTVTAQDASKVEGEQDPALTYTASGLCGSDSLTGDLARAAGETPGTYAITQGTLAASGNYLLTFTGATFTITSAPAPQPAPSGDSAAPVAPTYTITEGANATWNGTGSLVFRAVRDIEPETTFDHFLDLVVDNQLVPAECYTVENGSVIVTVSEDFLTSLPDGQHTIRLEFNDPACAEAFFTKAPAAAEESYGEGDATVAATGEAENFVAVILFAMSAACVFVSIKLKKEI